MVRSARSILIPLLAFALVASARAEGTSWRLDPRRSTIEVAVHSTLNDFVCRIAAFEVKIVVAPSHAIQQAVVTFPLNEVKTGRPQRDAQLQAWLQSDRFARVVFVLAELAPETGGGWRARGVLTLHGVEKTVTFPVRVLTQAPLQSIDGEALVDYRDFGLPVLRRFYVTSVDPHLAVRFHLQGRFGESDGPEPVRTTN